MPAFMTTILFFYGRSFVETVSVNGSWENSKNFVSFGIPYHQADTLPSQNGSVADLICSFQVLSWANCMENKNISVMKTNIFVPFDWFSKAWAIWKNLVRSINSSHAIIVATCNIRLFTNLTAFVFHINLLHRMLVVNSYKISAIFPFTYWHCFSSPPDHFAFLHFLLGYFLSIAFTIWTLGATDVNFVWA